MPQTITEKILARHSGRKKVSPDELVNIDLDVILCHEVTTPPAVTALEKMGMDTVFDADKIIVTPDHFVPNKDEKSAELAKRLRDWVKRHNIKNYYEIGRHGICHTILIEQGHIVPGETVVAGDSHTCTHGAVGAFGMGIGSTELAAAIATGKCWFRVPSTIKVNIEGKLQKGVFSKDVILQVISKIGVDGATDRAIEFTGKAVEDMEFEDRITLTNMAVEAGATVGIINPDKKTVDYVKSRSKKRFEIVRSDPDAEYERVLNFDVSKLEPLAGVPPLPSNAKPVKDIKDIKIDQAVIGSCTNGRINDLREAAKILKGNKVKDFVRAIIIPATTDIWKQAEKEGLFKIFTEAGATISTPTCGPCLGGHMGVLAAGETAIASTNRNFVGRMGSPKSYVYIASPATVAASAIEGKIADPRKYMGIDAYIKEGYKK
ncbi:3-isopropylmalate dehydratase large subunit [Candidatus Woesearchaeota archaeon]|nr:3-isopropylmalate dehydratase large subunit [Candidatus Woesearchaeota archaeon]